MAYQDHQESCIICLDPSPDLVSNVRCRCVYWYHTTCLNATPNKTQCPMCRSEVGPIYTDVYPIQLPVTITTPLVPAPVVVQPHSRIVPIPLQTKLISFLCVVSILIIIIFIMLKFMFGV